MEKEPTAYLYTVTSSYTQFILKISLQNNTPWNPHLWQGRNSLPQPLLCALCLYHVPHPHRCFGHRFPNGCNHRSASDVGVDLSSNQASCTCAHSIKFRSHLLYLRFNILQDSFIHQRLRCIRSSYAANYLATRYIPQCSCPSHPRALKVCIVNTGVKLNGKVSYLRFNS